MTIPKSALPKRRLHEGYFIIPVPHHWDIEAVGHVVWFALIPRSGMGEFEGGNPLNEIDGVYICSDLKEVSKTLQKEFNNAAN